MQERAHEVVIFISEKEIDVLATRDRTEFRFEKLPGIACALAGAVCVGLGTVLTKHFPLAMPPLSLAAWQVGLGCLPITIVGLAVEQPQLAALSYVGWLSLLYMMLVQFCLCHVCWFAALERLPRENFADFAADVDERLDDERQMRATLRALRTLSRADREVLALCVWEELTYEHAAFALGIPVGTVRSRLSRARARLRELSDNPGHEWDERIATEETT